MKFKFNGDVYQVHPVALKVMYVVFGIVIGIVGSFGMMPLIISILVALFIIAVVFRDGNIQ
jgi:hypothetical protein